MTHSTHVTALKMLVIAVHCQILIQYFISQFISIKMYFHRVGGSCYTSALLQDLYVRNYIISLLLGSWFFEVLMISADLLTAMSDINTV